MVRLSFYLITGCVLAATVFTDGCGTHERTQVGSRSTRYEDLLSLFTEWRNFQKPRIVDGVPDYSAPAMAAQQHNLAAYSLQRG